MNHVAQGCTLEVQIFKLGLNRLRFFRDDFAVFPNVDWRAVHPGGFAGNFGGAPKCPADRSGEFFRFLFYLGSLQGPCSNNRGVFPELSYTLQASVKSR